jgi:ubiquinone/menaquinone biosynthesis C-methylase UbiE
MATIGENDLSALLSENAGLRLIEPYIFSVLSDIEVANTYDTRFGNIYDWVACNPIYNRLIWGYSVAIFASIAHDALRSSKKGNVLDLGCGSLAFTAKTYIQCSERPVILVDQSLKMLRIAKSRLIKINGTVPNNMVFLHADALRLPFREKSFNTIISENLLHCLDDTKNLLQGLKNVLSKDGKMYFTTLVKGNRFADRYLEALANGGKLVSRNMGDHQTTYSQLGMSIKYNINGNMASIYYGD